MFVGVTWVCVGGLVLLGNRLRKMGDSGFYGYWASWDLHNAFQRTVWEQRGPRRNIKAHGNELEGLERLHFSPHLGTGVWDPNPCAPVGEEATGSPEDAWRLCIHSAPATGTVCTVSSKNVPALWLPLYLSYCLKGSLNTCTQHGKLPSVLPEPFTQALSFGS